MLGFNKAPKEPDPTPDKPFDPAATRELVWATLRTRVGKLNADAMREDFELHVAKDPIHGVEQGYLCMLGKMVETVDAFNTMLEAQAGGQIENPASDQPVSPFLTYRKDG